MQRDGLLSCLIVAQTPALEKRLSHCRHELKWIRSRMDKRTLELLAAEDLLHQRARFERNEISSADLARREVDVRRMLHDIGRWDLGAALAHNETWGIDRRAQVKKEQSEEKVLALADKANAEEERAHQKQLQLAVVRFEVPGAVQTSDSGLAATARSRLTLSLCPTLILRQSWSVRSSGPGLRRSGGGQPESRRGSAGRSTGLWHRPSTASTS